MNKLIKMCVFHLGILLLGWAVYSYQSEVFAMLLTTLYVIGTLLATIWLGIMLIWYPSFSDEDKHKVKEELEEMSSQYVNKVAPPLLVAHAAVSYLNFNNFTGLAISGIVFSLCILCTNLYAVSLLRNLREEFDNDN